MVNQFGQVELKAFIVSKLMLHAAGPSVTTDQAGTGLLVDVNCFLMYTVSGEVIPLHARIHLIHGLLVCTTKAEMILPTSHVCVSTIRNARTELLSVMAISGCPMLSNAQARIICVSRAGLRCAPSRGPELCCSLGV